MSGWYILSAIEASIALVLLAVCYTLAGKLRTKKHSNKLLIERVGELEQTMFESKRSEQATERKAQETADWFRNVFNNLQDIILVHGLNPDGTPGCFIEANDIACRLLGYDREEMLARTMIDIQDVEIPATAGFFAGTQMEDHARKLATKVVTNTLDKATKRNHVSYEDFFRSREGRKLPLLLNVMRCDRLGEPMFAWIGRDVTEIKEGQRAVRESQRRLDDFFSFSPLGIAMFDAERRLITVNRACLRMFGLPDHREFERFNMFDNPFLPHDAKQTLAKAESIHCEVVVDFDDARTVGLFVSTRPGKGHYDMLISNLGCDNEYRPRGYFAQIQDVTQRRKIESDLRKLQSMGVRGEAASGISGDLEDAPLTDIVQILCAGGKNMRIRITNRGGEAEVFIQGGNITHCALGDKQGEEAFYELMRWHDGKFTADPCEKFPQRTITVSAMALLMEGARRFDEGAPG